MLLDVLDRLICPHCGDGLSPSAGTARCGQGHAFDVARHGYLSLLRGGDPPHPGDSAAMVAAREAFLGRGHFAPLVAAVAAAAATESGGCIVDLGAGTGYYLAAALDAAPGAVAVAIDTSKPALRRCARLDRTGAVAADVWAGIPLRDAAADTVLNVFAPRNAPEVHRILAPGGRLVVVTPAPRHLEQLVGSLGLISVDPDKDRRIDEALAPLFSVGGSDTVTFEMALTREDIANVVTMGPSAHHVDRGSLAAHLASLDEPLTVTASAKVATYRRP